MFLNVPLTAQWSACICSFKLHLTASISLCIFWSCISFHQLSLCILFNSQWHVFLLSFSALQGKIGWAVTYTSSNISALRGSTVNISCIYKYPYGRYFRPTNVTTLWFTKGEIELPVNLKHDADYAGRVEYSDGEISCNWFSCKGTCTLRIKDLTQSDSAEYKFMFITNIERGKFTGDPGVMLSVTGKL